MGVGCGEGEGLVGFERRGAAAVGLRTVAGCRAWTGYGRTLMTVGAGWFGIGIGFGFGLGFVVVQFGGGTELAEGI